MKIEVSIDFYPVERHGRAAPLIKGSRLLCWLGNRAANDQESPNDAVVEEVDAPIQPGSHGVARLRPVVPELWEQVEVGKNYDLTEGFVTRIGRFEVRGIVDER